MNEIWVFTLILILPYNLQYTVYYSTGGSRQRQVWLMYSIILYMMA